MEVTNTFDGGMKSDYSPSNQPQKSYTYCLNGINISDVGDIFSLSNERGTINKVNNFPAGFKIIGGVVLNTDLIVCLVNPSGPYSQVGIIDANFSYTRVAPSSDTNNDLGFDITHQIDCQARKLFTGDRILYYTDNNVAIGFLNLDNPPSSLPGNISLFPQFQMPIVDFVSILEDGGNTHCGVYHFLARYKTAELNPTAFGFVSNPIPMVDEKRSVGRNAYDGGYPDFPITVGKSINLTITNLDIDYPFLEIVAVRYDGQQNELVVQAMPLLAINGNTTLSYTYTGNDSGVVTLTVDEVTSTPVVYNTAKCIEQKDGRLILSNIGTRSEIDNLQNIANNIIVKYRIEEIEYLDGISGAVTGLAFSTARPPYIIDDGEFVIYVEFTEQVNSTTATILTNYEINYDPSDSAAWAAGPDYLVDDTVTNTNKLYICIQAVGSGANAPTGAATDNTWWQYISPYIINPTSAALDPNNSSLVILTMDSTVPSQAISNGFELEIDGVTNFDNSSIITALTQVIVSDTGNNAVVDGYFNDYKNEERTYNLKGYMREEVYSFAMGVVYTDGTRSFSYHIPGSDHITAFTTAANTASKILGTYISTADYPSNQGHIGGKVRHHKMPTLIQEPHFRFDTVTGRTYIRVLGVDFTNVIIPSNVQNSIERVFFTRQARNNSQNRTILSQGIVNNLQRIERGFDYGDGSFQGNKAYKKTPFFNNTTITQTDATSLPTSRDSAVFEFNTPEASVGAFFSPDTTLLNKDITEFSKIKNVLTLTGGINRFFVPSDNTNSNAILKQTFRLFRPLQAYLFGNYTNYEIPGVQTSLDIDQKKFINALDDKKESTFFVDYPIDNSKSGKFLAIKTIGTIPNGNPNTLTLNLRMNATIESGQVGFRTQTNYDTLTGSDIIKNYLFNIYKDNAKQYGELDASEYILIHSTSNVALTSHNSVFGGDTFISKFGVGNKDNYEYKPLYYLITVGVPDANYWIDDTRFTPRVSGFDLKGLDLRALSYFFVESTVNCNYRHQFNDGINSGVKYFPKYTKDEVLLEDPRNGDATSYNTQYSFENTVQKFFSKPSVFTNVTRFETRSIYSEEAREDDTVDNYRIFLPNSFYDLPKHTGEIWDSFVSNNTLYLHTPKCLWRTFFNDTVQQANDVGETVMGTGGVFSLPAKEVLTAKGGYAGTISQYGGTHTPYGYVFPDALQGKIFLLGQGLNDISMNISRYISDNLSSGLVSGSNYIDNPSNPDSVGIISVYDFDRKRFVITKRGETSFTLSNSLLNPSDPTWISYHSYLPHLYFAINNGMFGFNNETTVIMHEHNKGDYGVYYGEPEQPFTLEYMINNNPNVEKSFDNLFIYSEAYDNNNFLELETFKSLRCTTTKKDTGLVVLTCTNLFNDASNVKKKKDRFQIAVPRNSLDANPMFRDRMKGEWMRVRLSYPNSDNYKLLVNFINSDIRSVSR